MIEKMCNGRKILPNLEEMQILPNLEVLWHKCSNKEKFFQIGRMVVEMCECRENLPNLEEFWKILPNFLSLRTTT